MSGKYIPAGNLYVSLPKIREEDAAIEDFTFLHMGCKGQIDVEGDAKGALVEPFVRVNGEAVSLGRPAWRRLGYWIPAFEAGAGALVFRGTYLTPVEERGFVTRLEVENRSGETLEISWGAKGRWAGASHCVNEAKVIEGSRHAYLSRWYGGLVLDMRCGTPLFAFSPMTDKPTKALFDRGETGVAYEVSREDTLAPGATETLTVYWGLGFEEVAAVTSAKEMLRHGYDALLRDTLAWLEARTKRFRFAEIEKLYNLNLFFCMFFAAGKTLDTEETVLVTSRSPRYYVSAAYWDRDSLLWSFPGVLEADPAFAREMLGYAFGRQRRNFGTHSRYIDGTMLEPGFELDELMAPILALERYTKATADRSILDESPVREGVADILKKLAGRRAPDTALYETFLQPTDDEITYPYLTYDNVLVWRALKALAALWPARYASLEAEADAVREAILERCVIEEAGERLFAWSVDLQGRHNVYDEPPGSLQLLPYWGFCAADDPVYAHTVRKIRSPEYRYSFSDCAFAEIGCAHAPHPWILSAANRLLCGAGEASLDFLRRVEMDNFIACESVDEHTGQSATGEAFATCAGFLCHAIYSAKEWRA